MKPKECAKYVYSPYPVHYYDKRRGHWLSEDFAFLDDLFARCAVQRLSFFHMGRNALAWRDKHCNIIVRVHHADTQTKIDF